MITLRPVTPNDIAAIADWPPYTGGFEQMDYALRENGWLSEFKDKPAAKIFIAGGNSRVVGFSLLNIEPAGSAEFRIALHPDWTGRGLGKTVTLKTLETGFGLLKLTKIHLIVRKNNPRAFKLYRSTGFYETGQCIRIIQGKDIEFIKMEISEIRFKKFLPGGNTLFR